MIHLREIAAEDAPISLLVAADPSEERVRGYLAGSTVVVAEELGTTVGALVLQRRDGGVAEIMNVAVAPEHRRRGVGAALVEKAAQRARELGALRLLVGTGNSSLGPLAFYQRQRFRISDVSRDHFKDYDPPIIEDGIRCIDMIHLTRDL